MKSWPAIPALFFVFSLPMLASSKEQRARGASLFVSSGCQHCHMIDNVGGHRGPDLSNVGRTANKSAIRDQILYGSKIMPAFEDVLEPQDIDDLIAYLHSRRQKSAR